MEELSGRYLEPVLCWQSKNLRLWLYGSWRDYASTCSDGHCESHKLPSVANQHILDRVAPMSTTRLVNPFLGIQIVLYALGVALLYTYRNDDLARIGILLHILVLAFMFLGIVNLYLLALSAIRDGFRKTLTPATTTLLFLVAFFIVAFPFIRSIIHSQSVYGIY